MEFEEKKREVLPLTKDELEVVVEALAYLYKCAAARCRRYKIKHSHMQNDVLERKRAFVQETYQYVTVIRNIRSGKLNPDVAAAAGLSMEPGNEEVSDSARDNELAGAEGTQTTDPRWGKASNFSGEETIDS